MDIYKILYEFQYIIIFIPIFDFVTLSNDFEYMYKHIIDIYFLKILKILFEKMCIFVGV